MVMPTLDYVSSSAQEHDEVWLHHTPQYLWLHLQISKVMRGHLLTQLLCGQ